MKLNNKGQSITQPYMLVMILFVVALFSFAYIDFGQDLASNPDSYINDESRLKIYERSSFTINNKTLGNEIVSVSDSEDPFFTTGENATGNPKDYALEFQFFRQQSTDIRVLAQNIYEIPTFYIWWLDLNYSDWKFIINGVNLLLWMAIFFAVYKFIRGLLK